MIILKRWFYWKRYGIKSGDTLKLTYDMFSEGMHSLIDVRF